MHRTMPQLTITLAHRPCISTRIVGTNTTLKLDTEPIGHGLPAVSTS
ncbi:MAG: hypothetical protein J0H50_03610 [Xanthomonadales bacterium]|nr:hypothetical protein [Xanthomonadales bacterium]